jgi:hypothetical protein
MKELIIDIINQLKTTTEPIIRLGVFYQDKQILIPNVITFDDVKELLILDLENYVNSLPDENTIITDEPNI